MRGDPTRRRDSSRTISIDNCEGPLGGPLLCQTATQHFIKVRVLVTRLLDRAEALPGAPAARWRDRRRLAKKRARAIEYSRGQDKKRQLYRDLVAATQASRAELQGFATELAKTAEPAVARWRAEVDHYLPLIARVIAQTQRRVFDGEAVPASEKLVSLFEPHADIIVKGGRQVQYGHKLNLTTGKSGLVLDVVIEAGNPADAERFLPMLDRHIARTGAPPRQNAADGGSGPPWASGISPRRVNTGSVRA